MSFGIELKAVATEQRFFGTFNPPPDFAVLLNEIT
jgi:hypothetical protein